MTRITPEHLSRAAWVYVRQSTPGQVRHNHESRGRQYALKGSRAATRVERRRVGRRRSGPLGWRDGASGL